MFTFIYTHVHMHIYAYVCTCLCLFMCLFICAHVCWHVHVHVYMFMGLCMLIYACFCLYVSTVAFSGLPDLPNWSSKMINCCCLEFPLHESVNQIRTQQRMLGLDITPDGLTLLLRAAAHKAWRTLCAESTKATTVTREFLPLSSGNVHQFLLQFRCYLSITI